MRTGRSTFVRGIAVGLIAGLLAGSAGMALAAFGKKGWERFGNMFKQGYVAGFTDCVRIAKALTPDGYIATTYVLPPRVKPIFWVQTINKLYSEKQNENRPMDQILVIAGHRLEATFGKEKMPPGPLQRLRKVFDARHQAHREALQKAKEAKLAGEGQEQAAGEQKSTEAKGEADKKKEHGEEGASMSPSEDSPLPKTTVHPRSYEGSRPAAPRRRPEGSHPGWR